MTSFGKVDIQDCDELSDGGVAPKPLTDTEISKTRLRNRKVKQDVGVSMKHRLATTEQKLTQALTELHNVMVTLCKENESSALEAVVVTLKAYLDTDGYFSHSRLREVMTQLVVSRTYKRFHFDVATKSIIERIVILSEYRDECAHLIRSGRA